MKGTKAIKIILFIILQTLLIATILYNITEEKDRLLNLTSRRYWDFIPISSYLVFGTTISLLIFNILKDGNNRND